MKLPFFISVPHGSLKIPDEIKDICLLSTEDIRKDSDEEAVEIYSSLKDEVLDIIMADVARAAVDLNRAPHDIGGDGVIKTHTCYNTPVYNKFPDEQLISLLIEKYYTPYHEKLRSAARVTGLKLGIDCHTMLDIGPPVGPDPGKKRPLICLSNAGTACPLDWLCSLATHLQTVFNEEVAINKPFKGGYITRHHATEIPWMQLEFSRTQSLSPHQKSNGLITALKKWVLNWPISNGKQNHG